MRRVNNGECQTRMGPALNERRTAHRKRGLNHQKPAGGSFIRRRICHDRVPALRIGLTRQRREFRDQTIDVWHPARSQNRLGKSLRHVRRHRRVEIMMMSIIVRRGLVIVMLRAVPHLLEMRAKRHAAMLEREMRAGEEPGEQHERCGDAAGEFHRRTHSIRSRHPQALSEHLRNAPMSSESLAGK
jgi:hypothetical protein